MAILTKAQLQAANSSSFPNNNSQLITPQVLRDYNTNVIDTLVDSLDTGSFARTDITNDFTQTNNFTSISASAFVSASNFVGDGSKLTNITASTALPILDEGVLQGFATSMNFTGSAISASVIAGTALVQVNIEGAGFVTTASFNAFTSSTNTSLTNLNASSASQQVSINALNTYTASQDSSSIVNSIAELNTFTASADIRLNNIEQTTASLNSSISQLNASSASQQISINALNVYTASQSTASIVNSITELNAFTASQEIYNNAISNKVTSLEIATASLFTSVANLNQSSASQQISIDALNTNSASVNTSISALNTFTASQSTASLVTSIDNLNTFSASALVSISNLNSATASLFGSASLALTTASFDNGTRNLTFTKGDNQTFSVNIPDVSGSAGTFVTTASFNAYTQSNDQRVSSLETNSASVNTSIANINTTTASLNTSVSALNTFTASQSTASLVTSIDNLNTFSASALVSISNLNSTTQSLNTSVTNLNSATASLFGSASLSLYTASAVGNTITFTKGDASTFNVSVIAAPIDTGSFATTASFNAYTQSNDDKVNSLINATASYATSAITASSLITASAVGNTITFTKGDASTFNVSVASTPIDTGSFATTASFNAYTQSNDQRVSSLETNSASVNISITNLNSATASLFTSASLGLTTASFSGNTLTFTKGDSSTFGVVIPDVSGSAGTTIFEVVYTGENITKGDPLYISGSQGANPKVFKADAAVPAKMPVTFVANETIGVNNTTNAIVLGLIEGIDLTGYVAGQSIYVAEGGGWSASLPSGSNSVTQLLGVVTKGGSGGKGLVLNPGPAQLPGLDTGYMWVGGTTNQPVEITTASFASSASFNSYTSSNDQKVDSLIAATGSYTTTSSFNAYTSSTDGRLNNIETTTASLLIETANLETFSASALISISNLNTTTASLNTSVSNLNTLTSSLATTGSNNFVGNQTITGSLILSSSATIELQVIGNSTFTGSVGGNVVSASITSNTASIDFNLGNYFEVTSSVTPLHLNVTNITPGRTSTLILSASASSSIRFSPNVAQPSGSAYSGSLGSIDVLSLVAFNTSKVNLVSTKALV
jgi:uncharacterized coiled-coil protein SlyX